ncbi:exo-alpha-sialidase [bacterium]|nr:exo-alpha-sialidase [bacterium]
MAPSPHHTDVYVSGRDGCHTYRIPAVLLTPKGTLLAFCEGRRNDARDHGDIDLMLKRSTDGGRTWNHQQVVYEEGGGARTTIGNPCPVVDEATGVVWLAFCRDNRDMLVTSSRDDGLTWSTPRDITKDVKKPGWGWVATGPGVGIQLRVGKHKGRLVIPCDHMYGKDRRRYHSHAIYSDDGGKTWHVGDETANGTNECQVVERADGTLLLNMRRAAPVKEPYRWTATSPDGGVTWAKPSFDETLTDPRCQGSLIRYKPSDSGDTLVLHSNIAHRSNRIRLTVRLSEDEGRTWAAARVLWPGHSAYSCLVALPDGTVGCLFEGGLRRPYEKIMFARFPLAWLRACDADAKP